MRTDRHGFASCGTHAAYGMNDSPGCAAQRHARFHQYDCVRNYQDHVSIAA
ncbi:hypothetical protein C7S16_4586 [Burkholderia thailandensis]|uniref:Uncharacterized protein n=1 Tax=Burkholderia thailandensis TaxID=57975 RepID=A0AAW9CP00_BURTH|nr:hypothetical protein [Burkholderia thailandensis]